MRLDRTGRARRPGIRAILCAALACLAGALLPMAPAAADDVPTIAGTPGSGVVGSPYTYSYDVTGTPTCSTTDPLPPGLALDAGTCTISGTPTAVGSYQFMVTATNNTPPAATITSTIVVQAAPTISGTPLPGQFWSLYSFAFTLTGTPTPTMTVSAGTPPAGLTLSTDGTLSGRPTRAGSYSFTVKADNGVAPAATEAVQMTIQPKPHITVTDARAKEGNTGLTAMTFVVSLTRTGLYDIPVHWATANGTARAASDYQAASGDLTFAPGELSKTITVQIRGDRLKERNETFKVQLSRTTHAEFDDTVAVGTIVNDD